MRQLAAFVHFDVFMFDVNNKMDYTNVTKAVVALVADTKTKQFEDLKAFVLGKVDADSAEALTEIFDEYKTTLEASLAADKKKASKPPVAEKKEKVKRPPSEYNLFIGAEMKKLRAATPSMTAKEAMAAAIQAWKAAKKTA